MLFLLSLVLVGPPPPCDVGLQGQATDVQMMAEELRAHDLKVALIGACRLSIKVSRDGEAWMVQKFQGGPKRRLETKTQAAFVILSWSFEEVALPLIVPEASSSTAASSRSQDAPPPQKDPRLPPVQIEQRQPPLDSFSEWTMQPLVWVGIDDAAETWVGGGIDVRYRWRLWEASFRIQGGTSGGARINPFATDTRRNSLDLMVGLGPVFEWKGLSFRPRLGLGLGGVWSHREPGAACSQPGTCSPETRQIADNFQAAAWVFKGLGGLELGWRIRGPLRLALEISAVFAPGESFFPSYTRELSPSVQRRASLAGVPWVLGQGSLGLAWELP